MAAERVDSSSASVLWYKNPASNWETQALPIGNGRLGAMLFGGVQQERIQFNEETLWIGDEEDTGAYQAFGDVLVQFGDPITHPAASSIKANQQQASPAGQGAESAADGDVSTKWCVENNGAFPLVWQARVKAEQKSPVITYTLTSAGDVPQRDPKAWRLLGSQDEKNWTLLDEQKDVPMWPARNSPPSYQLKNLTVYAH